MYVCMYVCNIRTITQLWGLVFKTCIVRTLPSSTTIEIIYIAFESTRLECAIHMKKILKIIHQHCGDIFCTPCGDQNLHSVGIVGTAGKRLMLWGHHIKRFPILVDRMQPLYKPINRTGMSPTTTRKQDRVKNLKNFPWLSHEHSFRVMFCPSAVPQTQSRHRHDVIIWLSF